MIDEGNVCGKSLFSTQLRELSAERNEYNKNGQDISHYGYLAQLQTLEPDSGFNESLKDFYKAGSDSQKKSHAGKVMNMKELSSKSQSSYMRKLIDKSPLEAVNLSNPAECQKI